MLLSSWMFINLIALFITRSRRRFRPNIRRGLPSRPNLPGIRSRLRPLPARNASGTSAPTVISARTEVTLTTTRTREVTFMTRVKTAARGNSTCIGNATSTMFVRHPNRHSCPPSLPRPRPLPQPHVRGASGISTRILADAVTVDPSTPKMRWRSLACSLVARFTSYTTRVGTAIATTFAPQQVSLLRNLSPRHQRNVAIVSGTSTALSVPTTMNGTATGTIATLLSKNAATIFLTVENVSTRMFATRLVQQ